MDLRTERRLETGPGSRSESYIIYIYIYRSLEDCPTKPIKMLQKIYWQNFRSTNDLLQCLSKLDWVCKD
jgi:hypothetical protein